MKTKLLALLLVALLTATSCAGGTENETTADTTSTDSIAETEAGWQYPDVDYAGAEYRILNFDQLWDMYIHMDVTEQTGEILNDAVYDRNRKIEDELNCKIVEKNIVNTTNAPTTLSDHAKETIMAGADEYETMQLSINQDASLVTGGYLLDLKAIDGFHFEETWWDRDVIDATTLYGKLYFASGASTLMAFDSMWCLFFNEDMMTEYGLDKPYDLVKEGKWTLDALTEYATTVTNLNADDSFTWNKNGTCLYGISSHDNAPEKFTFGCGIRGAEVAADDTILFTMESERFYNVVDKLSVLLNTKSGTTIHGHYEDYNADQGGYMYIFTNRRSLFLTAELKAAQLLRDMDDMFGIVPFPKFDEDQEKYYTTLVHQMLFLTLPTTNTKVDMTATIAEVMAHDSYETVIPVYYSNVVEHKGLRNEESVEMLEIMRENRGVDISTVFAWSNTLRDQIRDELFRGNNQVASILASQKSVVESNIEMFVEYLNQ